jgi:DnaJ-class molecular chaperone
MCSNCGWDQEYETPECPTCHGAGIVLDKPAGAGYEDDLPEYVPCPDCKGTGNAEKIHASE